MSTRFGIGYDAHPFVAGRKLVVGGVDVPGAKLGLGGHSDADVLCHAVIDAVFGACGLGDIGCHFPDTDTRYRDARSTSLLAQAAVLIRDSGFQVVAVDATVICEAPRLSPHRLQMRDTLAAALEIEPDAVNVKFTTNERMGFVGRGEGMAALAVATVASG